MVSSKRAGTGVLAVFILAGQFSCAAADAPAVQPQPPGPKIIFSDTFDTVKGEWQQVSGVWETRDGFLVQKSDDPRHLNSLRFILTPRSSDATIETSVRISPDRPAVLTNSEADAELLRNIRFVIGAGIVFRMQDAQNFYMFRLAGEEGAVLGRMVGGQWNEKDLCNPRVRDFLTGARIGFRADNWYRLKVEAYGNRITAYVNDEPVCSVTDDSFALGQTGLATFKTAADFDHITVSLK
jgi:hypothetical protein